MIGFPVQKKRYTIEEYFALEERAEQKHEFHNGKIVAMPGASFVHNQIQSNIILSIGNWIQENNLEMFVLGSDIKVRAERFNRFYYPDAVVICEKPAFWKGRKNTIANPVLIFEIASPSTEEYDKDEKFAIYRSIPTFREYVLIQQFSPRVHTHFRRPESEKLWEMETLENLEASARLQSIGLEIPLSKIYWKVPDLLGDEWNQS